MNLFNFITKRNSPFSEWGVFKNNIVPPISNIIQHLGCIYYLKSKYGTNCLIHWIIELNRWYKSILKYRFRPHKNDMEETLVDYKDVLDSYKAANLKMLLTDKFKAEFKIQGLSKYDSLCRAEDLAEIAYKHDYKNEIYNNLSNLIKNYKSSYIVNTCISTLNEKFNYYSKDLVSELKRRGYYR